MKRPFLSLLAFTSVALVFTACDAISEKQQREERRLAYDAKLLDKGNTALSACIETRCTELDLDGMRLSDFTVLNELTHIKSLMVSRTNFDDLADISGMTQLEELHISNTDVMSLNGIGEFTNLYLLHAQSLGAGPAIDASPIAALTGLTELAFGSLGSQEDAAFIKDLPVLENLVVAWSGEADNIGFLKDHKSLQRLEISGGLPMDQSALLSIPNLKSVTVLSGFTRQLDAETLDALVVRGVVMDELIVVC